MAVTITDIKTTFPEFDLGTPAADALITAKLAEAVAQVDVSLFQNSVNADSAIKYLTAHLMALTPGGLNMKLVKAGEEDTLYYPTYKRLIRVAAFGYRVP